MSKIIRRTIIITITESWTISWGNAPVDDWCDGDAQGEDFRTSLWLAALQPLRVWLQMRSIHWQAQPPCTA